MPACLIYDKSEIEEFQGDQSVEDDNDDDDIENDDE
jgi:hypothetical protein